MGSRFYFYVTENRNDKFSKDENHLTLFGIGFISCRSLKIWSLQSIREIYWLKNLNESRRFIVSRDISGFFVSRRGEEGEEL